MSSKRLRYCLQCGCSFGAVTAEMRVVVLSDSDVCIKAFSKGRSSAPRMLFAARRMGALLLMYDLVLDFVHVPSHLNPADALSRVPERPITSE